MNEVSERGIDAANVARASLGQFGVDESADVEFIAYRENSVFRVRTDAGDWSLKLHRPQLRDDDEIASEAAVTEQLAAAGFRVARPRRTTDGEWVAKVENLQITLSDWIASAKPIGDSGEIFEGGARPGTATLDALGEIVGRAHDHVSRVELPQGYRRPAWDAAGLSGANPLWGRADELLGLSAADRAVLTTADERLQLELAALPSDVDRFGFIHGDLTAENVLADSAGLTIIDFDDSGHGWYLFDIATVFFFYTPRADANEVLGALVAGYRRARALDEVDFAAWQHLLLARAMSYLGWSVERPDDPTTAFHLRALLPWILQAARRYCASGHTGWADLAESTGS